MTSLTWVDIDGVRYSCSGDQIDCHGQFGYHTRFDGHMLSQLEIENREGEAAGCLNVDFTSGQLAFTPYPGANIEGLTLLIGGEEGQSEVTLLSLVANEWGDLLAQNDETLLLELPADPDHQLPSPDSGQILTWDSFAFQDEQEEWIGSSDGASPPPLVGSDEGILFSEVDIDSVLDIPPHHPI